MTRRIAFAVLMALSCPSAGLAQAYGPAVVLAEPTFPYQAPSEPLVDEWDPLSAPSLTVVGYYALTTNSPTQVVIDDRVVLDQTLDAEDSYGGRLYFDLHLGTYLSVGAAVGLAKWTTMDELESGYGRSSLWSASGTLTLWIPANEHVRQYLRALGGLSFDSPSDAWIDGGTLRPSAGWHVGGVYGLYFGSSRAGFVMEIAAVMHHIRSRVRADGTNRGSMRRDLLELPMSAGIQLNL